MTEAVVMLSLMAFTWMMISYVNFMAGNGIRTASAARHAAWSLGNGVSVSGSSLHSGFYHWPNPHVSLSTAKEPIENIPTLSFILRLLIGSAFTVNHADVTYPETPGLNEYPFSILDFRFPFMRGGTGLANLNQVSASCEWAEMSDSWGAGSDILDLFSKLF